jgi:ABC-type transport system involved in multi-copper enzyme maturation permease subunit
MIQCLIKKILFSKHLLTIYSFICFIIFILFIGIISSNIRYASFAISPSFVRQEIQDGHKDLLEIDDSNYTITKVNVTDINKRIFNTIDIDHVSYFSEQNF